MRFRSVAVLSVFLACGGGGETTAPGEFVRVKMAVASANLFRGQSDQLGATPVDAAGRTVTGAGTASWNSSNTAVATVDGSGVVRAVGLGSSDIVATIGAFSGTTRVTVTQAPLAVTVSMPGLSFSPFQSFVRQGGTVNFEFPQLAHNVIFQSSSAPADIGIVSNVRVSRQFNTLGEFRYDCTLHPGMSGQVDVLP